MMKKHTSGLEFVDEITKNEILHIYIHLALVYPPAWVSKMGSGVSQVFSWTPNIAVSMLCVVGDW